MLSRLLGAVVGLAVAGGLSSSVDAVTVSDWTLLLDAVDGAGGESRPRDTTVVLPYTSSQTADTGTGAVSSADYDFIVSGDTASFDFTFDQIRPGANGAAASGSGDIHFTVATPSVFDIDGMHALSGDGTISMKVRLRDLTVSGGPSGFIYDSIQSSDMTMDQIFNVGGLDGDDDNSLVGMLPGSLIPGHEYLFQYNYRIAAPSIGDNGASAIGNLLLSIEPGSISAPVPLPAALPLFLSGLAGLGLIGWRRSRTNNIKGR